MRTVGRASACAVLAAATLAAGAGPAAAHATLVGSSPASGGRVKTGPAQVVLRFSEPVQVVNRRDVTVVDAAGVRIDAGAPRTAGRDPRQVLVPLRGPLVPDSYTVRVRVVSADSHAASAAFVFAVGHARLGAPILAGSGGLSDTSPAAVGARVAELGALMLLVGLLGFRALVWELAAQTARGLRPDERRRALADGRRLFWRAFWALTAIAAAAESAVLATKSAVVFHTGLGAAVAHPADAYRLVAASRFGDLLGWRWSALFLLAAAGFALWNHESARAPHGAHRIALAAMAVPSIAALTLLADQGHAAQAPLAPLSVAVDAAHLTAVSLWIGGLLGLVAVLVGAPRAHPDSGGGLASAALVRFGRVALWSVVVIAVTGLARAAGELSAPAQLVTTGYGNSLLLKTALLAPVLVLARRNRRLVTRVAMGWSPSAGRLRAAARTVQTELAIAAGIVVVAAVLVAQVPGRV
jgi:copper transport protein